MALFLLTDVAAGWHGLDLFPVAATDEKKATPCLQ